MREKMNENTIKIAGVNNRKRIYACPAVSGKRCEVCHQGDSPELRVIQLYLPVCDTKQLILYSSAAVQGTKINLCEACWQKARVAFFRAHTYS